MSVYKTFIQELSKPNEKDDEQFKYFTNKLFGMIYINKKEFCSYLNIEEPMILDWRNGLNLPQPENRKLIYSYYKSLVKDYFNV